MNDSDDYFPTVLDIETYPSGKLADIGLLYGENTYVTFSEWGHFLDYINTYGCKLSPKTKRRKHPELTEIWAHYGGGFDWLHFIEWFNENRDSYRHITIKCSGGIVIGIDVTLPNKRGTIRLRDSFRLMPKGLNSLAKSFGLTGKVNLEKKLPTEIKATNSEKYYEYLETDCRLLRAVLIRFFQSLRRVAPIPKLSTTIASQSMAVFKHFRDIRKFYQTRNDELKNWLRRGYTGGRVEVFQHGYFSLVDGYDFNSLYPSVMFAGVFPCAERGTWTADYHGENGLYEVSYNQSREFPALLRDETSRTFAHEGTGVFTKPELEKLQALGGSFDVIKGFEVEEEDCYQPFKEFVSTLWRLRRQAQQEKHEALSYTIKILLNSLYGKFGEQSERESFVLLDHDEMLEWVDEKGRILEPYDEGHDCYVWIHRAVATNSIIPIAAYVTAYARLKLYSAMESVGDAMVYADTDSVYFEPHKGSLPQNLIGRELGQLKPEFSGSGLFLGRKLYGLDGDFVGMGKSQKLKIKGVKLGGNMGNQITYEEFMQEWCQKKEAFEKNLEFKSFPTLREILTGKKKASKMVSRSRTIRPTY